MNRSLFIVLCLGSLDLHQAFSPSFGNCAVRHPSRSNHLPSPCVLDATGGGKKKRRRRRKKNQPPGSTLPDQVKTSQGNVEGMEEEEKEDDNVEELSEEEIYQIEDVAKFEFETDSAIKMGIRGEDMVVKPDAAIPLGADSGVIKDQEVSGAVGEPDSAVPLPDIREALKKKQEREEQARIEEEKERERVKIKRSDKEAFTKLLEQQPYADADDSFFEAEEYGTVSALLGEGSKPFLGIPSGPLQVGHFIGALGIILCAFVEYPGFPLTNLPTPLRDALQGGLLTVYLINAVLAVLAAFKAGERGQPVFLWVAKTFSVGGLAYDQLTQLPTEKEIAKAKKRSTF